MDRVPLADQGPTYSSQAAPLQTETTSTLLLATNSCNSVLKRAGNRPRTVEVWRILEPCVACQGADFEGSYSGPARKVKPSRQSLGHRVTASGIVYGSRVHGHDWSGARVCIKPSSLRSSTEYWQLLVFLTAHRQQSISPLGRPLTTSVLRASPAFGSYSRSWAPRPPGMLQILHISSSAFSSFLSINQSLLRFSIFDFSVHYN